LPIVIAVGVAAILWILQMGFAIDQRAVAFEPGVQPCGAARAGGELSPTNLASLH
jgi:hypothetical protein